MKTLRMGVVGVGALGKHHARILSQMEGVDLVGVAETRKEIAETVARDCNTVSYADARELIGRVDAAVIAVPTTAHEAVASEFLREGIPILIEKPLAKNLAESRRLVTLAEQTQTLLQVGHIERFNPATRVAWPLIEAPRYIRAERTSPFAFRSMDIGVVLDVMIHDIDLVLDLAGSPVRNIEAFGTAILDELEDCVQARLTFDNGCIADLTANRVHPTTSRSLQAFCPDRVVSVDYHARQVTCYEATDRLKYGPSLIEFATRPGVHIPQLKEELFGSFISVNQPPVPQADALTDELADFVLCVRRNCNPLVGGAEALSAMQVAEAILDRVAASGFQFSHQEAARPIRKAA